MKFDRQSLEQIKSNSVCMSDRILKYIVHGIEQIETERKYKLSDDYLEYLGTMYFEIRDSLAEFGGLKESEYGSLMINPKSIAVALLYIFFKQIFLDSGLIKHKLTQWQLEEMFGMKVPAIRNNYIKLKSFLEKADVL